METNGWLHQLGLFDRVHDSHDSADYFILQRNNQFRSFAVFSRLVIHINLLFKPVSEADLASNKDIIGVNYCNKEKQTLISDILWVYLTWHVHWMTCTTTCQFPVCLFRCLFRRLFSIFGGLLLRFLHLFLLLFGNNFVRFFFSFAFVPFYLLIMRIRERVSN